VHRIHLALLAAALTLVLTGCGRRSEEGQDFGKILPSTTRTLSVAGLGVAKRIEGFGHSYIGAFGVRRQRGFFTLVAKRYRITGGQAGGGGSTVVDQLDDVYARNLQRRSGRRAQLALVMWGINDIALYGRAVLPAFKNGLTALLSRIRVTPRDAHEFNDATVRLGSGWTTSGEAAYTTADAELDIDVSRHARGGTIGFIAPAAQGTGAVYGFKVDGKAAGRLDTRGLFPKAPKQPRGAPTPFIKRLRIPGGTRTVHVDVTNVQRRAAFYGWHMEATRAPLIVVLHQPRPAGYLAYDGAFHQPDDEDVNALNRATDAVIAMFIDDRVTAADADDKLRGDNVFFLEDRLHPNDIGHEWLAKSSIDAFEATARRVRKEAAG